MSEQKLKNLMKKEDFQRIEILFEKWWNWLAYLTFFYIFFYLTWSGLKVNLSYLSKVGKFFNRSNTSEIGKEIEIAWKIPIFVILIFIRGLMFCADGLVTSWLKSPFGQICYSINKSGIDNEMADEIITLMTEINEHFKETFKKFGILTISGDLIDFFYHIVLIDVAVKEAAQQGIDLETKNSFVNSFTSYKFLNLVANFSLLIPIMLAVKRVIQVKLLLNKIEVFD